jgi:hypothetical protein
MLLVLGEGYELENLSCDFHINRTNCCKNIPVPYEYPMVPQGSVGRLKAPLAQWRHVIRLGSIGVLCPRLWTRYLDRENNAEAPTLIFSSRCQGSRIPFCICDKETWLSFIFYLKWSTLVIRKLRTWIFATQCIETLLRIISESKDSETNKKFNILRNEKLRNVCWMKKHPIFRFNPET